MASVFSAASKSLYVKFTCKLYNNDLGPDNIFQLCALLIIP